MLRTRPREYILRAHDKIVDLCLLKLGDLDPILVCRKGDGTPEGAFHKCLLFNRLVNFVQDPNAAMPRPGDHAL